MTANSDRVKVVGDDRRAVALLTHVIRNDIVGVNLLLDEAQDAERSSQLVLSLCRLMITVRPELLDPRGQRMLQQLAALLSGAEVNA